MSFLSKWIHRGPRYHSYEGISNDDNKNDLFQEQERSNQKSSTLLFMQETRSFKWPALYFIAIAILMFNLVILVSSWLGFVRILILDRKGHPGYPPYMSVDTPRVFEEDTIFLAGAPQADEAWQNMTMNMKEGAVYIQNPGRYNLVSSELKSSITGIDKYPVTMYHQLHCLGTIRRFFYTLEISEADAYGGHVGHCFDFLRQGILCSADLTLEYTEVGWGVEHLCKNQDEVERFMQAYRART